MNHFWVDLYLIPIFMNKLWLVRRTLLMLDNFFLEKVFDGRVFVTFLWPLKGKVRDPVTFLTRGQKLSHHQQMVLTQR